MTMNAQIKNVSFKQFLNHNTLIIKHKMTQCSVQRYCALYFAKMTEFKFTSLQHLKQLMIENAITKKSKASFITKKSKASFRLAATSVHFK